MKGAKDYPPPSALSIPTGDSADTEGFEGFERPVSQEPWETLEPLPPIYQPVESLPPEMIPEPLRGWIVDVAERACWPLEMVAGPALVALSAVVGCKIGIYPKKYDDWLVVANLWGALVGRPGVMKSAAVAEGKRFLARLEAEAKEEYDRQVLASSVRKEVLEEEIKAVKRAMKGSKNE